MTIAAIPPSSLPQRMSMRQTPDTDFFAAYLQHYAQAVRQPVQEPLLAATTGASAMPPATADPRPDAQLLDQLLGDVHRAYAVRRGVGEEDQAHYAQILHRAYAGSGMSDPVAFLQSLTPAELAVIQRNHSLAEPIEPAGLSREGATNLLLPEGWRVDLDRNDLIEVGKARLMQFPPLDAPAEFKDAWLASTQGMDDMEISSYGLRMFMGMHTLTGQPQRLLPADQLDSYRLLVERMLAMLDDLRNQLPMEQYRRDQAFFSRLQTQLA